MPCSGGNSLELHQRTVQPGPRRLLDGDPRQQFLQFLPASRLVISRSDLQRFQILQLAKFRQARVSDTPAADIEVLQFLHALQERETSIGNLVIPLAERQILQPRQPFELCKTLIRKTRTANPQLFEVCELADRFRTSVGHLRNGPRPESAAA